MRRYEEALANAKRKVAEEPKQPHQRVEELDGSEVIPTGVSPETIRSIAHKIAVVPEGFHVNPKMVGQLARRAKMGDGSAPSIGRLLKALLSVRWCSRVRVRLSGQDSGRGTFSQRHAVLYDTQTGKAWAPLSELRSESNPEARFDVFDSSLSEEGVLGFEYGYTVVNHSASFYGKRSLAILVTARKRSSISTSRLRKTSGNRLRDGDVAATRLRRTGTGTLERALERYLQLCAENNLQVCYPTTPAQYFHLLRRQVRPGMERPLIVMTPKSLLRLPAASSSIDDLERRLRPLIDDAEISDRDAVKRVVLCSGKVYYDLIEARKKTEKRDVAVVRLEQFYPFPLQSIREMIASIRMRGARMGSGRAAKHGRLDVCSGTPRESSLKLPAPALHRTHRLSEPRNRLIQHPPERTSRISQRGLEATD